MNRPDERQLRDAIDEARAILDDMELGVLDRSRPDGRRWSLSAFELRERASIRTRDGFPPANGGGSGGQTKKGGDYGGGVVPALALAPGEGRSEDRQHWDRFLLDLQCGLVYLRRTIDDLVKATPAQRHPDRPNLTCCRVCSRPNDEPVIYRSERCRWCWEFWRLWGVDAPEPILKLRREGRRITENIIRAELAEELAG